MVKPLAEEASELFSSAEAPIVGARFTQIVGALFATIVGALFAPIVGVTLSVLIMSSQ